MKKFTVVTFKINMKTIAIINYKGGVAKTTSVQNIGAGLALKGKKVLMVDLDGQANLTKGFGLLDVEAEESIYHAFIGKRDLPILEIKKNLFIVPSHIDFCNIEAELASNPFGATIFSKHLRKIKEQYDYCLLDCPPSLGIITVNALVSSDYILIPLEAEGFSWQGLDSIFKAIKVVQEGMEVKKFIIGDRFQNIGAFLAKVKNTRSITNGIRVKAKANLGDILYSCEIRENVAICESQILGKDIFDYDSKCNGAKDYKKLIAELEKN